MELLWCCHINMENNDFKFHFGEESKKCVKLGKEAFNRSLIMSTQLWEELKVPFSTERNKTKQKFTQLPTYKLSIKLIIWEIRSTQQCDGNAKGYGEQTGF